MLPPLQVDNIFVFIRQVAPVPACWLLHQQQVDFDLVVSESRVTWAIYVSILVFQFLGLSLLELGPMYATDVRQKPPRYGGGGFCLTCALECRYDCPDDVNF